MHHGQMYNLEHHNKLRKQSRTNSGRVNIDVI